MLESKTRFYWPNDHMVISHAQYDHFQNTSYKDVPITTYGFCIIYLLFLLITLQEAFSFLFLLFYYIFFFSFTWHAFGFRSRTIDIIIIARCIRLSSVTHVTAIKISKLQNRYTWQISYNFLFLFQYIPITHALCDDFFFLWMLYLILILLLIVNRAILLYL